jgi:HK97 family phage portal protein
MGFLKRAKPPDVPEVSARPGSSWPPYGASTDLDWIWAAIGAGMWTGAPPLGLPITEADVLAIPAVSASLSLLSTYMLQMPLQSVREGTTPPEVLNPTPTILRGPLGDPRLTNLTLADWVGGVVRDLALYGNYLAVLGDLAWDGWPRVMYPVAPAYWEVCYDNGVLVYRINEVEYAPADVFHVAINRSTGELVGRGLLSGNRDAICAGVMAERWAARDFETGATPSIHITHPNPDLTQAQADELKAKFLAASKGERVPVITPLGTTIDVLPNDAQSAQLVEARKWAAQELAIALGVSPAMLGLEGPSMTYRNIAEVHQQFINSTLMGYIKPLEQQLSAQCLPGGQSASFNMAALIRPDFAERTSQAIALVQSGLLTVDEGRALIDLGPMTMTEPAMPGPAPVAAPGPALVAVGGGT